MALDDFFSALSDNPGAANAYASATPADVAPASGGSLGLGKQIYEYFRAKGLSAEQSAALAGNMVWESGGSPSNVTAGDNIRNSPRSPHSVGIGQWNDRAPALIAFARSQGVDVPEGSTSNASYMRDVIKRIPLNTQLDFAWTEMQGPERRAFSMVKDAGSLDEAMKGGISYHRPAGWSWANPSGGHGFAQREGLAKQILASTGPTTPAATVADRFGAWNGNADSGSTPAIPAVPAAPAQEPITKTASAPAASPMSGLFDAQPQGGDALQKAIQTAIQQSEQRQEASNAAAAADPVLKMPLKQADLRSVLELIQRMGARGPLGTMGA